MYTLSLCLLLLSCYLSLFPMMKSPRALRPIGVEGFAHIEGPAEGVDEALGEGGRRWAHMIDGIDGAFEKPERTIAIIAADTVCKKARFQKDVNCSSGKYR
jgi:hypothetical protein